ncbi:MAG: group III truncated hemoglobin [Phycisphaerales bacterium JB047]
MPNHPTRLPLGTPESGGPSPDSATVSIDEIRVMVERFYEHARDDELLGPIFAERVEDWDRHYDTMTRFWSSAVLRAGTYSGRPIEKHQIAGLTPQHFLNWVQRFTDTVVEEFGPERAAVFIDLGRRMAVSISSRIGVEGVDRALAKSA